MSPIRPPWASTNFSDWTNIPPEPQHGSNTRPLYGASISTSTRTTQRGVNWPPFLPSARRTGQEILVDPAQDILAPVLGIAQADGADQVDQLAQPLLVQRRPGVVLGQRAFEPRLSRIDGRPCASSIKLPMVGCLAWACRYAQRASIGHPEHVGGQILDPSVFQHRIPLFRVLERTTRCPGSAVPVPVAGDAPRTHPRCTSGRSATTCLYSAAPLAHLSAVEPQLGLEPRSRGYRSSDFACSVTSRVKSDALRARTKPPVTAVGLGRKAALERPPPPQSGQARLPAKPQGTQWP